MFGSDSAPHPISKKSVVGVAAGVFTAPIALQTLTELFEKHHALANLQALVSDHAQMIYGYKPPFERGCFAKKYPHLFLTLTVTLFLCLQTRA